MRGLAAIALVACTGVDREVRRIEGVWVSVDASTGEQRALDVERLDAPIGGIAHGYTLYLNDVEASPKAVQGGLFSIVDDEVLWDVRWSTDPLQIGIRYADPFERLSRSQIRIGERSYDAADEVPPGRTTPWAFGEVAWAVETRNGRANGLSVGPDDTVWAGSSHIASTTASLIRGGELVGQVDAGGLFERFAGAGGDLGVGDAFGTGRYAPRIEPGDAFVPDRLVLDPVWTAAPRCGGLVEAWGGWVGRCWEGSGALMLTRFDPETGAHTATRELEFTSPPGLWSLGDDVLVQTRGPSPTPDVHGERGADGWRLERIAVDGSVSASFWSPSFFRVVDVGLLDDGALAIVAATSAELPGAPGDTSNGARLLALDGQTGALRWQRDLPLADADPAAIEAIPGGFALALPVDGGDLGGQVGALGPATGNGHALGLVGFDLCGEARDAAVFEDCTPGCGGFETNGPRVQVGDLVRDADGMLLLHAELFGRFRFGRTDIGYEGAGVVARAAAPPTPPACEPDLDEPVVRVTVVGAGSVELAGLGVCTGTCSWPAPAFAELEITATPGPGQQVEQVSGACDDLPCTAWADGLETSIEVVFGEATRARVDLSAPIARLDAGAAHAFASGHLGPGELMAIGGVAIADGTVDGAWIAALDASGAIVAHGAVPRTPQGPYVWDLSAQPALERAAMLTLGGADVHTLGLTGLLTSGTAPAGPTWDHVAIDGLGAVAVAGTQGSALALAAVDGSWSHTLPAAGAPNVFELVGLPGGGFVALAMPGGWIEVDGVTWSGGPYDLAFVRVDASGSLVGGSLTTYGAIPANTNRVWLDAGALHVTTVTPLQAGLPFDAQYVERYDLDGAHLGTDATGPGEGVWAWSGGTVVFGRTSSPTSPWGGPPLPHAGGLDSALGWFDATGGFVRADAIGSAADDYLSPPLPLAVLPDGTAMLASPVDGPPGARALGVFFPP